MFRLQVELGYDFGMGLQCEYDSFSVQGCLVLRSKDRRCTRGFRYENADTDVVGICYKTFGSVLPGSFELVLQVVHSQSNQAMYACVIHK